MIEFDNTHLEEVAEKATKSNIVLFCVASGTIGALLGYFIGYKTSIKVLEPKYVARADEEIKEAKVFYSALRKQGEFKTPESAVEALIDDPEGQSLVEAAHALSNYKGGLLSGVEEPERAVISKNVFTDSAFVWDYEVEKAKRNRLEPFVIHEDEWSERPEGYNMVTLTYYEGDNTLADEKDEAIPDVEGTVGEDNLGRFGHGTQDPRTVFVRNERLEIDFEILLHDGKYAHEVLGFQHGEKLALRDNKHELRRFRPE